MQARRVAVDGQPVHAVVTCIRLSRPVAPTRDSNEGITELIDRRFSWLVELGTPLDVGVWSPIYAVGPALLLDCFGFMKVPGRELGIRRG